MRFFVSSVLHILCVVLSISYAKFQISVVESFYDENLLEFVEEKERYFDNNNNTIISKSGKRLDLTCDANFPIQWDISGVSTGTRLRTLFYREFHDENLMELSSINYRATLALPLTQETTGSVKCTSIDKNSEFLVQELHVYVSGEQDFVSSDHGSVLELHDGNFLVPCQVTDPSILPTLKTNKGEPVDAQFDPKRGFLLDAEPLMDEYICESRNQSMKFSRNPTNGHVTAQILAMPQADQIVADESQHVELSCSSRESVTLTYPPEINATRLLIPGSMELVTLKFEMPNYSFNVTCFSKNQSHLWKIQLREKFDIRFDMAFDTGLCFASNITKSLANFYCENKNDCAVKKRCLEAGTCQHFINSGIKCKGGPCYKIDRPFTTGLMVCKSGQSTSSMEYFTGLDRIKYFSWIEAPLDAIVSMDELPPVYYLQGNNELTVVCESVNFLFANTLQFGIQYTNGTLKLMEYRSVASPSERVSKRITKAVAVYRVELSVDENVNKVYCFAPFWNSTQWLNVSREITIKRSIAPTITNQQDEQVLFIGLEQQILLCNSSGQPTPSVRWEKLPGTYNSNTTMKSIDLKDGSAILQFGAIQPEDAGYYLCTATNREGSTEKKIKLTVQHSQTNWTLIVLPVVVVVFCFSIVTLLFWKRHQNLKNFIHELSEQEIQAFFKGCPNLLKRSNMAHENVEHLPFNNLYEIMKSEIVFDRSIVLGSGAYGIVYGGKLINGTEVALKTVQENCDKKDFKALLSEIKTMMYMGSHSNIVEFFGANTENIRSMDVYIVSEYCPNGNLNTFLRQRSVKPSNKKHDTVSETLYSNGKQSEITHSAEFRESDLFRWCKEILCGMEYLAKKKIIHGDLATRNVLLDKDFTAKITDFGLSRKLYEYSQYVKKEQVALPWRWMSIEALKQMSFSIYSDVWSYGITVWEIYSNGDIPYPGLNWTPDFVDKLENGYRLKKPESCPDSLYETILECWMPLPEERPNFSDLCINHFRQDPTITK